MPGANTRSLSLISDDQVWLQRLKTEFYFSVEEAQHLKDRMRVKIGLVAFTTKMF